MDQDQRQIEAMLDALETVDHRIEALAEQVAELRSEAAMPKEGRDDMYAHAEALVISAGKASASFLQRRLSIGYSRTAMLMDMLFERGVIGPVDGSKPRAVLAKPDPDTLS